MDLSKFRDLPESLSPSEIRVLFDELLSGGGDDSEAVEVSKSLDEIADRQWHTYTRLDEEYRNRLDSWICRKWAATPTELTALVTSIIAKIGLPRSAAFLRDALDRELPEAVREEITNSLRELGDNVDDPYSGMKS